MGQTDSGRFFEISKCRWHSLVRGVRRPEIVFEALAQTEANAPLGAVLNLDLKEGDIVVVFEVFPQISGMAAVFVDADLRSAHRQNSLCVVSVSIEYFQIRISDL